MTMRYILIDQHTGYIWGDSADYAADNPPTDPVDAALKLDLSLHDEPGEYETTNQSDAAATYHIYSADGDQVPCVWDGQDQNTIDEVIRLCPYVTSLRRAY